MAATASTTEARLHARARIPRGRGGGLSDHRGLGEALAVLLLRRQSCGRLHRDRLELLLDGSELGLDRLGVGARVGGKQASQLVVELATPPHENPTLLGQLAELSGGAHVALLPGTSRSVSSFDHAGLRCHRFLQGSRQHSDNHIHIDESIVFASDTSNVILHI